MTEYQSIQSALSEYAKIVPVQQLRRGAERYAPLRKNASGSWRVIMSDLIPVAVAWTDWENGFDIITLETGEVSDQLGNYVITAKALDIPAGWAYTTLDTTIKRFDSEYGVTLSEQENGKLSEVQQIDNAKEEENGTEQGV